MNVKAEYNGIDNLYSYFLYKQLENTVYSHAIDLLNLPSLFFNSLN